METTESPLPPTFASLGLADPLLRAIDDAGYEAPTPIQAATIPSLLAGRDLIGQAQTGTGKTAAFGLPLLQSIDPASRETQALVLAPTRELAIQVAEALHTYSKYLPNLVILPVYGGQPIDGQQKRLLRGVHVVVGTPGRVMDHIRRGALRLDRLRIVVLDEADEMLRMGFIEDVEWILSQAPPSGARAAAQVSPPGASHLVEAGAAGPAGDAGASHLVGRTRQTALFSATMPAEIRRIAQRHLFEPATLETAHRAVTLPAIEQRYLMAPYPQKLEALTRILESEPIDAVLVFTRTKTTSAEVAEKLEARGYSVAAMHGDMTQPLRERVIERLREGSVEIVVATDVAARGLDVDRISHVINFDIPSDVEAYVHRIGRTGRAGRTGVAVVFVTPRERHMLHEIERFTGRKILPMQMPTPADVAARRKNQFKDSLRKALAEADLELYMSLIEELVEEGHEIAEVAAAAAFLARRDRPLELAIEAPQRQDLPRGADDGMVRLVFDAGRQSGVRPGDIVGAIANEAGVPGKEIGAIDILEHISMVEVPSRYAPTVLAKMAKSTLRGRPLTIRAAGEMDPPPRPRSASGPASRPAGSTPGRWPTTGKPGARPGGRPGSAERRPGPPWKKK
jgi:ATP-dependent RNA helicase DeaD